MKSYAVIFTYSFDPDAAVYLFDTFEEAAEFLAKSFEEELRIDLEENKWNSVGSISEEHDYAKITTTFYDHEDMTEFHLGNVYL